jgi:hypothetical protein
MSVVIRTRDTGYRALEQRLEKAAKSLELTVGIHDDAGAAAHGPFSVIDIATKNEFGLGVPARSFIGAWADERHASHEDDLRKLGRALIKGTVPSPKIGMAQLGEAYVGQVQTRIAGGIAPPNSPVTIKRKGSSTPLIHTGVLRSSIAAKVDGEGAAGIAAAAGGGEKKGKKKRGGKLGKKIARKLRALTRQLKRAGRRGLKATRRGARRGMKLARRSRRSLVRQAKRSLRASRRYRKSLMRSGRRAQKTLVRTGRRILKSSTRTAKSTVRSVRRAAKTVFGRRGRRRR